MRTNYTEIELDALRELANIGAGTAATSLSGLLGMPIDVAVPSAAAMPLADAIDHTGPAELCVTGVAIPLHGDLCGSALMLFPEEDVSTLCGLLGLEPDSEYAASALGEVVNILCASYLGALSDMTGMAIELGPPEQVVDMLGAIMGSILAMSAGAGDIALMLDSALIIEGQACSLSFLLIPSADGVDGLLTQLGLG
ncbi:MAG TPA: chemotaxis protein CheC [Solirubrobacteraceae bacterium]|nr:chemotaxis protein CheC [Solirubrobacteraceae bacterium]